MNHMVHSVFPAGLHDQFDAQLTSLANSGILSRFWAKDMSLWPRDSRHFAVSHHLDWLDLPDHLETFLNPVSAFFSSSALEEFDQILFVGLHAASLAAELVASLPLNVPDKRFALLNTLDPLVIRHVEDEIDLSRTLFFVATKQDTSLRVSLLLLHFLKRFKDARIPSPGSRFIVFTEESSYVAHLAKTYAFRELFVDPPGILPQFSGLINYGTLLTSLRACTPGEITAYVQDAANSCSPSVAPDQNPALRLAALFRAVSASSGRLLFLADPRLAPLADRLAFIVSSACCRDNHGIVALRPAEPFLANLSSPEDLLVILTQDDRPSPALEALSREYREARRPVLQVNLPRLVHVPSLVFCWEVASCLAASLFGVNPFDESDLQELQALVHSDLDIASQPALPRRSTPRIGDSLVDLYFEGSTRRELSTLSLELTARTFLRLIPNHGYLFLLNFLPSSAELSQRVAALQADLQHAVGFPVSLGADSRWVHRGAQMLLAGPPAGAVLLLTADSPSDIPVAGADYTFGRVRNAYASAFYFAISQRARHIVRAHLRGNLSESLDHLSAILLHAAVPRGDSTASGA
jgi:hypothetical protein